MTDAYCMRCRASRPMKDAERVILKNGKQATTGTCDCGTKMFKIGPQDPVGPAQWLSKLTISDFQRNVIDDWKSDRKVPLSEDDYWLHRDKPVLEDGEIAEGGMIVNKAEETYDDSDRCPECNCNAGSLHAPGCPNRAMPGEDLAPPVGLGVAEDQAREHVADLVRVNKVLDAIEGSYEKDHKTPVSGRYFETGAYRDTDDGKNDYEGFLSPLVIERFGDYMTENRKQSDGQMRASDNWQKGVPQDQYMKSMWRHFLAVWKWHRYGDDTEEQEEALCALMFNVMGYLHEHLKEQDW